MRFLRYTSNRPFATVRGRSLRGWFYETLFYAHCSGSVVADDAFLRMPILLMTPSVIFSRRSMDAYKSDNGRDYEDDRRDEEWQRQMSGRSPQTI
ncbi:Uncharacterised protein [Citrobacter koseri]|uniref:Uncharacterized protein n=1 Tax=Citrobacter koseri TaxID=545 RepID=A0A2X2XH27_CITKO|nr:Uncharacterised protein [Citrobacter koseri]